MLKGIVIENRGDTILAAEGNIENRSGLIERPKSKHIRGYIRIPDGYRYQSSMMDYQTKNLTVIRCSCSAQILNLAWREIPVDDKHVKYMKRCYELAISAGKKGHDTFGAVLVHDGEILEEAENTADYGRRIFGHAEFNLVHKCANKYSDEILEHAVVYTSCAPCERCLAAIASLGVHRIVCGVSYKEFCKLLPFDYQAVDREGLLKQLGIQMTLTESVLEEEGMHVFEWWGGEYHPLEELIAEMDEVKKKQE